MQKAILLLLVLFSSIVFGQNFSKSEAYKIYKYDASKSTSSFKIVHLKSFFGSGNVKTVPIPEDFKANNIIAIDYYYTDFKTDTGFAQVKLDSLRFQNLNEKYPQVYSRLDEVPVRFFEQTLARSKKEAMFYYHGFVVHYKTDSITTGEREKEINKLEYLFKNDFEIDEGPKFGTIRPISGTRPGDYLNVWGKQIILNKPDTIILAAKRSIPKDVQMNTRGIDFVTCFKEGRMINYDSLQVKMYRIPRNYYPGSAPHPFSSSNFGIMETDYASSKLFMMGAKQEPLKNEVTGKLYESLMNFEGDSIIVVIDVTGSMLSAISKVLKWIHHPKIEKKIKGIVLFNDGDKKKLYEKSINSTGGIYYVDDLKILKETLILAMTNGSGGDVPENDIEAILKAREHFKTGSIVLIADNLSEPRDFSLLSKVYFPVNILVCNGLETIDSYMDIADATGGVLINKR